MTIRTVAALRLVLILVSVCLGLQLVASPAEAHAGLVTSNPANDAQLDQAPGSVNLSFNEGIEPSSVKVTVSDATDTSVIDGKPVVTGGQVAQPLMTVEPGIFFVTYTVKSQDGHIISGALKFTVKNPEKVTKPSTGISLTAPNQSTFSATTSSANPESQSSLITDSVPDATDAKTTTATANKKQKTSDNLPVVVGGIVILVLIAAVSIFVIRRRRHS